jgi:hypothetical protein
VKHPGGSQKQRRHLWPATCPSIDHRGAPALFLEGFQHDERRAGPSDSGYPHPTRQPETRRSRPRPAAEQGVISHDRRGFARSSQTSVGCNFGTFAPDPDTVLETLNLGPALCAISSEIRRTSASSSRTRRRGAIDDPLSLYAPSKTVRCSGARDGTAPVRPRCYTISALASI